VWTGVGQNRAAWEHLIGLIDEAVKETVTRSAVKLVAEAQSNFQGSHARGMPHIGGLFPNIVSGNLRRSIQAEPITRFGTADYGTSVGPRMIYGRRVELGFKGSAKYPFFKPAVDKVDIAGIAFKTWTKYLPA
jgi:hypothetical protein